MQYSLSKNNQLFHRRFVLTVLIHNFKDQSFDLHSVLTCASRNLFIDVASNLFMTLSYCISRLLSIKDTGSSKTKPNNCHVGTLAKWSPDGEQIIGGSTKPPPRHMLTCHMEKGGDDATMQERD